MRLMRRPLMRQHGSFMSRSILTLPIFFGEVRGWSRLYDTLSPAAATVS